MSLGGIWRHDVAEPGRVRKIRQDRVPFFFSGTRSLNGLE